MDFSALYREEKTKRLSSSAAAAVTKSRSRKKDSSSHSSSREKIKSSRSHNHKSEKDKSKSSNRKEKPHTTTTKKKNSIKLKKRAAPSDNPASSVHPALVLGPAHSRGSSIKLLSLRPPEPQDTVEVPTPPLRKDESFYREWNYEGEGSKHHGAFQLNIKQNSAYGHGGLVWDCSLVLARFLQRHLDARAWKGKWVLELGAGTGLVGLVAASLGAARVRLSDLSEITPLLEDNVKLNSGMIKRSDVKVIDFCWGSTDAEVLMTDHRRGSWAKHKETFLSRLSLARGGSNSYSQSATASLATTSTSAASAGSSGKSIHPVSPESVHKSPLTSNPISSNVHAGNHHSRSRSRRNGRPNSPESPTSSSSSRRFFDIVVASDVAYDPSSFEPLREVLREVCGPKTLVFMSHEWRAKDKEDTFFSTLKPEFVCELVPLVDLDPEYQTEDISVFKIRRLLL